MATKPECRSQTTGTPFFNEMNELMDDLSTIRSLAEKLSKKMEEISKSAPDNTNPD